MSLFSTRARLDEMMDDFAIVDERLLRALDQLRWVNRWLGGYGASLAVLKPFLLGLNGSPVSVLDVGSGVADFPEHLVRWSARHAVNVRVTALDANPATVAYASAVLDRRLARSLRRRIDTFCGDATALPYADGSFDVVHCSLFLHHFEGEAAERVLAEMHRVAARGVVVNDLHRHRLAYAGIKVLVTVLPVSSMFRHDGPVSVLRAFRRHELEDLAARAGLDPVRVRWRWAFRWTLSTLDAREPS